MPPFEILRPLGKGAMGAVYEVRVPGDPRRLVAKLLTSVSQNAKERFRREGELVARLDGHPGIVSVHSHGVLEDGNPYLLFDLVEGTSLFQLLRQAGVLPLERVIEIGRELSAALAHAHANGIVHRDVKPENILIDAHGRVRLADFGLGLAADQLRLTVSGVAVGTPLYMAPEQVVGKQGRVGPWTDVHAVGLVLAECLRGSAVFHGDSSKELAANVVAEVPEPLRVDPGIDAIVACCLEKRAEDRYPHAGELEKDLAQLSRGATPVALTDSKQRTWLLVAIAVLALLGVSLIAVGARKRSQSRDVPLDSRSLLAEGQRALEVATQRLSGAEVTTGAASLHDVRLDLEQAVKEDPSKELRILLASHFALEAELALVAGDTSGAATLIEGAELGEAATAAHTRHVAALEAGLATLATVEGEDLTAHREALIQANRLWPQRPHFFVWRTQLGVRAGAFADAVEALQGLSDPASVPLAVRFAAYLGADELEAAEGLAADVSDSALVAQLYYRLAIQGLGDTDLSNARAHVRRALSDGPDDPLRAKLMAKAKVLVDERGAWDPDRFGNEERFRLLRWEVDARLLYKHLAPKHRMLMTRAEELRLVVKDLLVKRGVRELDTVADLVRLNPGYEQYERDYLRVASENGYPNQEQALAVLKSAYTFAAGGRRGPLTVQYALALRSMGRLDLFSEIAGRAERSDAPPKTQAIVNSIWGDTLRQKGHTEEARTKLKLSMKLDPTTPWPHSHMFRLCRDQGQFGLAREFAWSYLQRVERGNLALPRRDSERVHEAVAWIEARGDAKDTVRALKALTEIKGDAIHAASRRARLLCDDRSATPADLDLVGRCLSARADRVTLYAKRSRLDPARVAPLLARIETLRRELTTQVRERLLAGEFEAVQRDLVRFEKALPVN